jgi:hypothetical protein
MTSPSTVSSTAVRPEARLRARTIQLCEAMPPMNSSPRWPQTAQDTWQSPGMTGGMHAPPKNRPALRATTHASARATTASRPACSGTATMAPRASPGRRCDTPTWFRKETRRLHPRSPPPRTRRRHRLLEAGGSRAAMITRLAQEYRAGCIAGAPAPFLASPLIAKLGHHSFVDRAAGRRDRRAGLLCPSLRESPRCLLAARSAATCKHTWLSLAWRNGHRGRRQARCLVRTNGRRVCGDRRRFRLPDGHAQPRVRTALRPRRSGAAEGVGAGRRPAPVQIGDGGRRGPFSGM